MQRLILSAPSRSASGPGDAQQAMIAACDTRMVSAASRQQFQALRVRLGDGSQPDAGASACADTRNPGRRHNAHS